MFGDGKLRPCGRPKSAATAIAALEKCASGPTNRAAATQLNLEETTMNLVRYEPWGLVNQLQGEVNRLFDHGYFDRDRDSGVTASDWIPAWTSRKRIIAS